MELIKLNNYNKTILTNLPTPHKIIIYHEQNSEPYLNTRNKNILKKYINENSFEIYDFRERYFDGNGRNFTKHLDTWIAVRIRHGNFVIKFNRGQSKNYFWTVNNKERTEFVLSNFQMLIEKTLKEQQIFLNREQLINTLPPKEKCYYILKSYYGRMSPSSRHYYRIRKNQDENFHQIVTEGIDINLLLSKIRQLDEMGFKLIDFKIEEVC